MQSLQERKQLRLVLFLQRRKKETGKSIRQLAREAGVNNSTIERFFKQGCSEMAYKDAVKLLLLLGITPTQAADKLGLTGPLPQNQEEALIVEAAWKLSQLPEQDRQAIIRIIDQRFELLERKEVS